MLEYVVRIKLKSGAVSCVNCHYTELNYTKDYQILYGDNMKFICMIPIDDVLDVRAEEI